MKRVIAVLTFLLAVVAIGATKGDPSPFAVTGIARCAGDGGANLIPLTPGQNAIAMRNIVIDGGTTGNINIGETAAIASSQYLGFPIKDGETLSIDVVAVNAGRTITPPTFIDGGVTVTLGTNVPAIYCGAGVVGDRDLHLIKVR